MSEASTEGPVMTRVASARQWARTYLEDHGGWAPSHDILRAGAAAGYSTSTMHAARRATHDIVIVRAGRNSEWRLVSDEELEGVAAAHATSVDALEEQRRDRSRPFRTVVTHWPCKGLSRIVTDTHDSTAPGGVVRHTSWVHSEPTTCNVQSPTVEGEAR